MVDAGKLVLFAVEALGLLGVLFLLQRIIRTSKRRSDPVNSEPTESLRFLLWWSNGKRQEGQEPGLTRRCRYIHGQRQDDLAAGYFRYERQLVVAPIRPLTEAKRRDA